MASFDVGFDVAAPPEISPEDADILNDIFSQDIVFEEVAKSTSTYEAQQELEKAFSEDRKEATATYQKGNNGNQQTHRHTWRKSADDLF